MDEFLSAAPVDLITLEEARDQFPGDIKPSKRWISSKVQELGLGHKFGRRIYVKADFIEQVLQCQTGISGKKVTKAGKGIWYARARLRFRNADGGFERRLLNSVVRRAQSQKPERKREPTRSSTSKSSIVHFPRPKP
jgi:hypothetical protein